VRPGAVRRIGMLLLAIALTATVRLAVPSVTVACSCAMLEAPMQAAAGDASLSVFTGIAGPLEAAGVQVKVTRWFQGAMPPSGIAVLDPGGFNDPMGDVFNSCGTNAPGQGTEWVFIAGRNEVGRYGVSLCSTHAPLAAPEGQALLADAQDVFGPPAVPGPPVADKNDIDTTSPIETVLPFVLGGLFAVGLVGGLFGILGRRGRDEV
jgi:hypothetical protein